MIVILGIQEVLIDVVRAGLFTESYLRTPFPSPSTVSFPFGRALPSTHKEDPLFERSLYGQAIQDGYSLLSVYPLLDQPLLHS